MILFSGIRPLLILLLLAACGRAQEAAASSSADEASYRMRAGDVVRLQIFGEPDLAVQTRILNTGEAVFPLVGAMKMAGLSLAEGTEEIRTAYDKDYLVNPKITLTVDDYARETVAILGAVNRPGEVNLPATGKLDLASALAAAGGAAPTAVGGRVTVIRVNGTSVNFDLAGAAEGNSTMLEAGDRVVVAESGFVGKSVTLLGQVRGQGPQAFPLDGKLDLVTAIARAGGFTDLANPRRIRVNRGGEIIPVDARKLAESADEPFWLQPDDIITVPERIF